MLFPPNVLLALLANSFHHGLTTLKMLPLPLLQVPLKGPGHKPTHLQHHVRWMHYCNTVQEHSPVVCSTEREPWRTGTATVGVEHRVVSDTSAPVGGRWRSARSDDAGRGECWRRVSARVQLLVVEETHRAHTTM